jgi:hypothetical protein
MTLSDLSDLDGDGSLDLKVFQGAASACWTARTLRKLRP